MVNIGKYLISPSLEVPGAIHREGLHTPRYKRTGKREKKRDRRKDETIPRLQCTLGFECGAINSNKMNFYIYDNAADSQRQIIFRSSFLHI